MATTGEVNITITDGGGSNVTTPANSIQVVIGCCMLGTVNQLVATRSPQTLASTCGLGPGVEAAALSCLAGGTAIFVKVPTVTVGAATAITFTGTGTSVPTIQGAVTLTSTSSTGVNPTIVTASANHNYVTGDVIAISGVTGNTAANGTWPITVLSATTFSIPVTSNGTGAGGTSTKTPYDTYYCQVLCTTGGTIGTGPVNIQISLDAGRSFGPIIALGTANVYAIPNTGITLKFAAGTLVTNDTFNFSTTEPLWNQAGLLAAFNVLQASQYALTGWGSMHVVGKCAGADVSTIDGYMSTWATNYLYERVITHARDGAAPVAWGGAGETEATWIAAVAADYAAVAAKRVSPSAGHYNMPSAFPNPVAGAPRYRRPLSFAYAARQVAIPPQRHAGRVRDGALSNIVVNPSTDPFDGFIYHDERITLGIDIARMTSARTRTSTGGGFYITNPNLGSPAGSDYVWLPNGNVIDIACGIVHQVGQQQINDDVVLNLNGTLESTELLRIQNTMQNALTANMTNQGMCSATKVSIDPTVNVQSTKTVAATVTVIGKGYIATETINVGFGNTAQAA